MDTYIDVILQIIEDARYGQFADGQVIVDVDEKVDRWFLRELVEFLPESVQLVGDVDDYSVFDDVRYIMLLGKPGSIPSAIAVFTSELEQCIWNDRYEKSGDMNHP